MKYEDLPDEQLLLCLSQNSCEAYDELYRRSIEYGRSSSRALEIQFSLPYYDEAEFISSVSVAFYNTVNSYIVGSVPYIYYFNVIFNNEYRNALIKLSKISRNTFSLDTPISNTEGLTLLDSFIDESEPDCQIATRNNFTLEAINDSCDTIFKNLSDRMVIAYRLAGCSYAEIARLTKMSQKRVRIILHNKRFLKDLENIKKLK